MLPFIFSIKSDTFTSLKNSVSNSSFNSTTILAFFISISLYMVIPPIIKPITTKNAIPAVIKIFFFFFILLSFLSCLIVCYFF